MDRATLLVPHGPRGDRAARRTVELARPTSTTVAVEQGALPSAVGRLAVAVSGNSVVDVIHLVDPAATTEEAFLVEVAAAAAQAAQHPAMIFRQWVIAMIGQEWDDSELWLLRTAGRAGPTSGLFITARSSEARGLAGNDDEVATASDLAYLFSVSGLLASMKEGAHWTAGVAMAAYRRRVLVAALVAHHCARFLDDTLLAPLPAQQPYGAQGAQWPVLAGIAGEAHIDALSRGAMGGTVFEPLVDATAFDDTPLERLPDALRSYFEELSSEQIERIRQQIGRNGDEHLAQTRAALLAAAVNTLRDSRSIASSEEFVRNLDVGLGELARGVDIRLATADAQESDEHETVLRELQRRIRRLPFGAAVVARAAGFAALGVLGWIVVSVLVWPAGWPFLGALVGVVAAGATFAWYLPKRARVRSLRAQYLDAIRAALGLEIQRIVLRRLRDEITALRESAAGGDESTLSRLGRLRGQLQSLRERYADRAEHRGYGALFPTAFSILVPHADDLSAEEIGRRARLSPDFSVGDAVLHAALPGTDLTDLDVDAVDEELVDMFAAVVERHLWTDMPSLLEQAEATRERVSAVLSTRMSPLVRRRAFQESEDVRRFFVGADPSMLGEGVDVDGGVQSRDSDTLAVVALRPVPANVAAGGVEEAS